MTAEDIRVPATFAAHCQRNVPPCAARPIGTWPRFVSEIDVALPSLLPDPHGKPPCYWLPPNAVGARVSAIWEVTELADGSIVIARVP